MCGIIGMYTDNYDSRYAVLLRELFLASQIRGKHATGLTYLKKYWNELETVIRPVPSSQFVKQFDFSTLPTQLRLIGHCRYSTSDLEYNQPITIGEHSLVHNGVITQADPEYWKKAHGYDCETRNDSELLLRHIIKDGMKPFDKYPISSIAAIYVNGLQMTFFRNGTRPLWWCKLDDAVLLASTKDIFVRAFKNARLTYLERTIRRALPGMVYRVDLPSIVRQRHGYVDEKQNSMHCEVHYKPVEL